MNFWLQGYSASFPFPSWLFFFPLTCCENTFLWESLTSLTSLSLLRRRVRKRKLDSSMRVFLSKPLPWYPCLPWNFRCRSCWPHTCYHLPASASLELGQHVCATTPGDKWLSLSLICFLVCVHFLPYLISPSFLFVVRYFNYVSLFNILESTFSYFKSGKQVFYNPHSV